MSELGEGSELAPAPEKEFEAEVLAIRCKDGFKAAHNETTITGNHWPAPLHKGKYSQAPAVYAFGGKSAQDVEVTIKVTSKGYSGNGKLTGYGASLLFEGSCPLTNGEHKVTVSLVDTPDAMTWFKGNTAWGIDLPDSSVLVGNAFLEIFFVFADPSKLPFFSSDGVWTEAIRYAFMNGYLAGTRIKTDATKKLTSMCFNNKPRVKNHTYEIKRGASAYGGMSKIFKLGKYMKPKKGTVNCYDQAYAVIVFGGCIGLAVDGVYMNPFGYLARSNLVGYGPCNNPFPQEKYLDELSKGRASGRSLTDYFVVANDDPLRQPFGNHMFCEFKALIYDACAGPALGKGDRAHYAGKAVDSTTSLYRLFGFAPGTPADMSPLSAASIRGYGIHDVSVTAVA